LIPCLEEVFRRLFLKLLFGATLAISVMVQAIGAFCWEGQFEATLEREESEGVWDRIEKRFWDWSASTILLAASDGPHPDHWDLYLKLKSRWSPLDVDSTVAVGNSEPVFPVYQPGTRIDFSQAPCRSFLFGVWHGHSPEVQWSGREAAIGFQLDQVEPLRLRMMGTTCGEQRVIVSLNGRAVKTLRGSGAGPELMELDLPAAALAARNTLTLQVPDAKSPLSLGQGDDPRILGIGIAWLELVPLPMEGSLDVADGETIAGWAWAPARPDSPIQVEIYDGEVLLATVVADQFRQDLFDAGTGSGKYAFFLPTPARLQDGKAHVIHAKIAAERELMHQELMGSPKQFHQEEASDNRAARH
jgi:hypothetical protein